MKLQEYAFSVCTKLRQYAHSVCPRQHAQMGTNRRNVQSDSILALKAANSEELTKYERLRGEEMDDLISRQAAINTAFTMRCRCDTNDIDDYANMILEALKVLPTIEPKHGKWIYHEPLDVFECSVCGRQMVRNIFNYCPNCGAKMERSEE